MKKNFNIIHSSWFLICLASLLLNDFILKEVYHNWFTGKLSDLCGLFVFPLFWISFFPKHKMKVFVVTALFFMLWKSSLSQSTIDTWNSFGYLPINRVVDYSDLWALLVLPISYYYSLFDHTIKLRTSSLLTIFIAGFAFTATSYDRNFEENKKYTFSISKTELVERLNNITRDSLAQNHLLSLNLQHANHHNMNEQDTLWYHSSAFDTHTDTFYQDKNRTKIDKIHSWQVPQLDSMYPNREGIFLYQFPTLKYMKVSNTSYCHTLPARVKIEGNDSTSALTLLKIYTHNCMGMFEKEAAEQEERNLIHAFDMEVIDKIRQSNP